jgi:hypothetical protein
MNATTKRQKPPQLQQPVALRLPWPPRAWAARRDQRKAYQNEVWTLLTSTKPSPGTFTGPVVIRCTCSPPDGRQFAYLTGCADALADALAANRVIQHQRQVGELTLLRSAPAPGGYLDVLISPATAAPWRA